MTAAARSAREKERFEQFGQTLVPIMTKLGADPGQPMVSTIHNVQHG